MVELLEIYTAGHIHLATVKDNQIYWQEDYGDLATIQILDIQRQKYIKRVYNEHGNLVVMIPFEHNKEHGQAINFDFAGNIHSKVSFHYGKKEGRGYTFHSDGTIQRQFEYKNDIVHGRWISYILGRPLRVIHYHYGVAEGPAFSLDSNGYVEEAYMYSKDEIIFQYKPNRKIRNIDKAAIELKNKMQLRNMHVIKKEY